MRLFIFVLCSLLMSTALRADVSPALPDPMLKRIKAAPDRFLESAAVLIHGFGAGGSIDRAGVERSLALSRAIARASAQRQLLAADLDGDGAVSLEELAVAAGASGATTRGRLITTHARADRNSDGVVSMGELATHAAAEAQRQVSEADAAYARGVLACDQNNDGAVTLVEVKRALAALDQGV